MAHNVEMVFPSRSTFALFAFLTCGCSSGGTGLPGGAVGGGGGSTGGTAGSAGVPNSGGATQGCAGLGRSQTLSEPCCAGYGPDACGAGLFCAAFDGRTQLTCYAEGSRLDMSECTADSQCASGVCSPNASKCRSLPGAPCTDTIGCANAGNNQYVCVAGSCELTTGKLGDPCNAETTCQVGQCSSGVCLGIEGTACSSKTDCRSDLCCNEMCDVCGQGVGETCTPPPFNMLVCKPGLTCCPLDSGSGGIDYYCYSTC